MTLASCTEQTETKAYMSGITNDRMCFDLVSPYKVQKI